MAPGDLYNPSHGQRWEVPTFSPSQVPVKEQVLHSIFTPPRSVSESSRKLTTRNNNYYSSHYKRGDDDSDTRSDHRHHHHHRSHYSYSRRHTPLTTYSAAPQIPEMNIMNYPTKHHGGQNFSSGYQTPTIQRSPKGHTANSGFEKDPFVATQTSLSFSPVSSISAVTEPSSSTVDNTNMLNFDYIQRCTSQDDLERIIRILMDHKTCPSLLKAAQDRQRHLQQSITTDAPAPNAHPNNGKNSLRIGIPPIPKQHTSYCGGGLAVGPTIPSSPSPLNGLQFIQSPTDYNPTNSSSIAQRFFPQGPTPLRSITETEQFTHSNNNNSLTDEVVQLTKDLGRSHTEYSEQFITKLQTLVSAKKDAESTARQLQEEVTIANKECRGLVDSLERVQRDYRATQEILQRERDAAVHNTRKFDDVERTLKQKIADLTQKLANVKEDLRLAPANAEKELRGLFQEDLKKKEHENFTLNTQLRECRRNLETLKQSHTQFKYEMLRAMGTDKRELDTIMNSSHKEFINNFCKKMASMKSATEAMAKAFAESEQDRLKVVASRDMAEQRLSQTIASKHRLEQENCRLLREIQTLSEEVASGRAYIDKLLGAAHDVEQSDWEKKEQKYKTIISNLQQQLRKENTMVSIELYRQAIEENKKKDQEIVDREKQIETLSNEISDLTNSAQSKPNKFPSNTPNPINIIHTPSQKTGDKLDGGGSPIDYLERGLFTSDTPTSADFVQVTPQHDPIESSRQTSNTTLVDMKKIRPGKFENLKGPRKSPPLAAKPSKSTSNNKNDTGINTSVNGKRTSPIDVSNKYEASTKRVELSNNKKTGLEKLGKRDVQNKTTNTQLQQNKNHSKTLMKPTNNHSTTMSHAYSLHLSNKSQQIRPTTKKEGTKSLETNKPNPKKSLVPAVAPPPPPPSTVVSSSNNNKHNKPQKPQSANKTNATTGVINMESKAPREERQRRLREITNTIANVERDMNGSKQKQQGHHQETFHHSHSKPNKTKTRSGTENSQPKVNTATSVKVNDIQQSESPRSVMRITKLRAAGGLKGLKNQLHQMRSPRGTQTSMTTPSR